MYTIEQQRIGLRIQTLLLKLRHSGNVILPDQFSAAQSESMAILDLLIENNILREYTVDPKAENDYYEASEWYACPNCNGQAVVGDTYCPCCGVKLNWELVEAEDALEAAKYEKKREMYFLLGMMEDQDGAGLIAEMLSGKFDYGEEKET